MSKPRRTWKQVDGVLLLDKPLHLSSNDALQKARRFFSAAKAGHTGTLDPLATGLLPVCFGEATKFSADLLDADKAYVADVRLGQTTATGDAEGEVLQTRPVQVSAEQLAAVLPRFTGVIAQVPPMYSALKRDGKPLYELARQGLEVEREAREVTILSLAASDFDGINFRLHVDCSKGTYIRTLAEDIGETLGCGAHLTGLRRTRVGPLELDRAVSLVELENTEEADRWKPCCGACPRYCWRLNPCSALPTAIRWQPTSSPARPGSMVRVSCRGWERSGKASCGPTACCARRTTARGVQNSREWLEFSCYSSAPCV